MTYNVFSGTLNLTQLQTIYFSVDMFLNMEYRQPLKTHLC